MDEIKDSALDPLGRRKRSSVDVAMYGIRSVRVREHGEGSEITAMDFSTPGADVRLVAYDDVAAWEILAQLRKACDEYQQLLDERAHRRSGHASDAELAEVAR